MSRSRPEQDRVNPAHKFFEWKASTGTLEYYDKELQESVVVELPFTFLVLDQLNTVGGFDPSSELGYFGNEVRGSSELITVRQRNGIVATGAWEDVKVLKGIKFCKSIYIAYKDGDELVIGNIQAKGAFLGEWFQYAKTTSVMSGAITIRAGETVDKKGMRPYILPAFSSKAVSDATNAEALELDKVLQEYLDGYFAASQPVADPAGDFPPTEVEMANKARVAGVVGDITVAPTGGEPQEEEDDDFPF